jgi:hypothetical protein
MKKRFYLFGMITLIIGVILVFISCDLFDDGIPVRNDTNWTIQVGFSSDRQNVNGGWTTISSKKTERISVNDGTWYIGIISDASNAPVSAHRDPANPNTVFSTSTISVSNDISSITITFQDGVDARYIYTVNYNNNTVNYYIKY